MNSRRVMAQADLLVLAGGTSRNHEHLRLRPPVDGSHLPAPSSSFHVVFLIVTKRRAEP